MLLLLFSVSCYRDCDTRWSWITHILLSAHARSPPSEAPRSLTLLPQCWAWLLLCLAHRGAGKLPVNSSHVEFHSNSLRKKFNMSAWLSRAQSKNCQQSRETVSFKIIVNNLLCQYPFPPPLPALVRIPLKCKTSKQSYLLYCKKPFFATKKTNS